MNERLAYELAFKIIERWGVKLQLHKAEQLAELIADKLVEAYRQGLRG